MVPDAEQSVDSPVDFGYLFRFSFRDCSDSRVGMLFTFSMEQRSAQIGLLQALGWKTRKIRFVFWVEGLSAAIVGSAMGVFLASIYGKVILELLSGKWSGAVAGARFEYDASFTSIIIGSVSSACICFLSMIWSTRKLLVP